VENNAHPAICDKAVCFKIRADAGLGFSRQAIERLDPDIALPVDDFGGGCSAGCGSVNQ
jgi:hypothetical protein